MLSTWSIYRHQKSNVNLRMVSCCVPYCRSTTKKGSRFKRRVYEFPSNAEMRNKWIRNISRRTDGGKQLWQPGPSGRDSVCELHFNEDDFKSGLKIRRLKPEAVPSIFPGYPSYKQQSIKHGPPSKKRMLHISEEQNKSKAFTVPIKDEIAANEEGTNTINTNQENSKNISVSSKHKICSAVSENNIIKHDSETDIVNTNQNSKHTPILTKNKIHSAITEDSIVIVKQEAGVDNINENLKSTDTLNKHIICNEITKTNTTTNEQETDKTNENSKSTSLILGNSSATSALLTKHKLHNAVTENTIITCEQEANTNSTNQENSNNKSNMLIKHEVCSASTEDSITMDEQAISINNTTEETSENTSCLNREKWTNPISEKLLAIKRSQISRMKRKIEELEHQLQMKDNILNDPLTKSIFSVIIKSRKGDKSAIFLLDLLNNHGKVHRRWSDVTARSCLVWRRYYAKGYEFARQNRILHLPSRSTLKKFLDSTEESEVKTIAEQSDEL